MNRTVTIAPVRKSIRVNAHQAHAFEVFTSGLGRWWPRTHTIGKPPMQTAVLEPRLGGRWYELSEDGSQADVGKVLVWEPPQRFVISWDLNSKWKPDTTVSSEVEVRFIAQGTDATLVELEHRKSGWARKRAPPCARTWTAAGRACWSTSRTRPRRRADRRRHLAAPDNAEFYIARRTS